MDTFRVALKKAEKDSEVKAKEYLIAEGCTNIVHNEDGRYDFIYTRPDGKTETLEVKQDNEYPKTGNVAIEVRSRGEASAICKSIADVWMYYVGERLFKAKRADVLLYLIQHWDRYRRVNGGDKKDGIGTSLCCILKFDDFLDIFSPI